MVKVSEREKKKKLIILRYTNLKSCAPFVMSSKISWTLVFCSLTVCHAFRFADDNYLEFPPGFRIGAGGSAYQYEGAWNESDKGESSWDRFAHLVPSRIKDGSNGDVACDSYHKYKEDVQWVKTTGFDTYRLSLSWTRILPNGYPNNISEVGIRYYHNLIDELLENGIEPIVTLYHWDHPQIFEDQGGWTNDLMVTWFADYARIVFRELGSKVKIFTTINEPMVLCKGGYDGGFHAPGKALTPFGGWICGHNILKAHATAYHIYDEEFRPMQQGQIGITLPCGGQEAKNPGDEASVETSFQFTCGWIAHPIFSMTGDYPELMKRRIARNSKAEGYPRSRLPVLSEYWIEYIRGTSDYFGLNHYSSVLVEPGPKDQAGPWLLDSGLVGSLDPSWPKSASDWLRVAPSGFGNLLRKIRDEYNNPLVYVLENGISDSGTLTDYQRIDYFYAYLKELLTAVKRDGCNVALYTVWSLLDNFEWTSGYGERFGLINVDFEDPNRTRTPKLSVEWWKHVLRTRKLQPNFADRENSRYDP